MTAKGLGYIAVLRRKIGDHHVLTMSREVSR